MRSGGLDGERSGRNRCMMSDDCRAAAPLPRASSGGSGGKPDGSPATKGGGLDERESRPVEGLAPKPGNANGTADWLPERRASAAGWLPVGALPKARRPSMLFTPNCGTAGAATAGAGAALGAGAGASGANASGASAGGGAGSGAAARAGAAAGAGQFAGGAGAVGAGSGAGGRAAGCIVCNAAATSAVIGRAIVIIGGGASDAGPAGAAGGPAGARALASAPRV